MARGGQRTAKPGSMLPNRSDMRTTQPIQATPGGDYGDRKAQEDLQRAMPLQNAAGAAQAAQSQPAQPSVYPGELGAFDRPTERPNEALGAMPTDQLNIGDPADDNIREYLPALELLSTLPDTSQTTRNFIRNLRGRLR